ncbi:hypothetical protein LOK49_LG06G00215 [Camellia lanceoleosa]|nr:hypothetical protein LOK49_LG06G00215 [Camellia lanceoleosa]
MGEAGRESSLDDRLIDTLSDSAHAIGFRLLLPLLLPPFTIIYITRSLQYRSLIIFFYNCFVFVLFCFFFVFGRSVSDALIVVEIALIGGPRV